MAIFDVPIEITVDDCIMCGLCVELCPSNPGVYEMGEVSAVVVNPDACEQCMLCTDNCPTDAIKMRWREIEREGEA
jgi:ferredoxin